MGVGLLIACLRYGLYFGLLSKFFSLFLFVTRSMSALPCCFTLAANTRIRAKRRLFPQSYKTLRVQTNLNL